MKILLLGEFSGFFDNLKDGLISLGHDVITINSGDGWKKIGSRQKIKLFSNSKFKYIRLIENLFLLIFNIKKIKDFDIVQIISPIIFGYRFNQNILALRYISKNNKKVFLSVAGDHYNIKFVFENLKYSPPLNEATFNNRRKINDEKVLNIVSGIIPVMYTYAEVYRNHKKLLDTIPLPLNSNEIKFSNQVFKDNKILIFHGLNREDEKGTKYILEAMHKLKKNFPNKVEILVEGKLPFKIYKKLLEEANIIVDQALSYEYGMNALYSMAMGKIVLSGNEIECQEEFKRYDIPIINIKPNANDIYDKLVSLINNKEKIIEIGNKSRLFVEDFHNHIKIAQKYVDLWNSVKGEINE
jgi:glycosyltransferase involved in cell wall biosynthesis